MAVAEVVLLLLPPLSALRLELAAMGLIARAGGRTVTRVPLEPLEVLLRE